MTMRCKIAPDSGAMVCAIYSGTDDLPFSDPYTYISRVKHHSAFKYLGFDPAQTISTTVSTPATVSSRAYSVTLGAHGQSGIPYVFGVVQVNSVWVPLKGSIPVNMLTGSTTNGNTQWWSLTVDETNVYIDELRSKPTMTALSLSVIVYVSDRIT